MKTYFCYLYERHGQVPYMEAVSAADDAQARDQALTLLHARPGRDRVEIWEDVRRVAELDRDGLRGHPMRPVMVQDTFSPQT